MASYRPFPPRPQSTFRPPPPPPANQPPPPPSAMPSQQGTQYNKNWNSYQQPQQNYSQMNPGFRPPQPPPPSQQQYQYQPPPPPPDNSYQPPPPPPSSGQRFYPPGGQYSQYSLQPLHPPPPPSSPPPSSAAPPPPPPPQSPPPPPSSMPSSSRGPAPPIPVKKSNDPPPERVETEEERRLKKKKEFEKRRQEEKHKQQLKESQNRVLQKTHMASGSRGHGSIIGSHAGDRRTVPLLSGDRIENRLRKPTTFLCKLKFRNELPDQTAQPKLMSLKRDKDRFTKYSISSLEKMHKPRLYVEPDLGIPLDLLDLSVYNPPKGIKLELEPEDQELLHDDTPLTPIKKDGMKRKERPTDEGVSWLVKTQYISSLSMESSKQSLSEKQAKEMRESRSLLANVNSRARQIQEIEASFEASFEACKARPVHATNPKLQPVEILPLFPDFDRYDDQYVVANFDNAPTADSEIFGKLDKETRDLHESQAIMKSFAATTSDSAKPDKFLAYMVPGPDELSKDVYDESQDLSYSWIREYHWDVRGEDADDLTTYLVSFGESEAHYLPLPTKLMLRKKRAREGKSSDEVEHFPVPLRTTVRKRSTVAAIELKEEAEGYSASKESESSPKRARLDMEDDMHDIEADQSSGDYESD